MSTTTSIQNRLSELRFHGMQKAYQAYLATNQPAITASELVDHLLQAEWEYRQNRQIASRITQARFRYQACLQQINYRAARNLSKEQILRLSDCSFIAKKENLLITGSTGVGKSYIASAFGQQACSLGYRVLYFNTMKLFSKMKMAKADDSYLKELNRIEKHHLLILDDFGLQAFDAQACLSLLEILEDRHGKTSTIINSQIPVKNWYELLGEQTIADAVLDRLVHNAHRIELAGESMRKVKNMQ